MQVLRDRREWIVAQKGRSSGCQFVEHHSQSVKIGATINSIRSLKELQRRLLESLFEIIPAERGAILLLDGNLDNPSSVFALDKFYSQHQTLKVSRTVAQQVINEGVAILSNDIIESETKVSKFGDARR